MSPFNGDTFLHAEVARLIGKWDIKRVVETGTWKGHTAIALSLLADQVTTIEVNPEFFAEAAENFKLTPERGVIHNYIGSSPDIIRELGLMQYRHLYYLDAHWEEKWPLLDELKEIADLMSHLRPVIVIHDFKHPTKDFGFDSYHGHDLDLPYVQKSLEKIYGIGGFMARHNRLATGAQRGVAFIEPV